MSIYAVVVESQGWPGAPGFNTYYFEGLGEGTNVSDPTKAAAAASLIDGFLTGIASHTSEDVTMTIQRDVVARDPNTGEGLAVHSTSETPQAGVQLGQLQSTPTMIVANWRTATFGPRGRGRNFLPPGSEANNIASGQIASTALDDIQAAQSALVSAAEADLEVNFVVWSRPVFDPDTGQRTRDGITSEVVSGFPKSSWGVLRSRRD